MGAMTEIVTGTRLRPLELGVEEDDVCKVVPIG
jgi:hypothetical protein